MSKELEARKTLNKYRNFWYNEIDKEKVEVANALNVILTYPTQEEVCKELSRHTGREVIYDNNNLLKCFYVLVPMGRLTLVRVEEDCVVFNTYHWLTPHLITLIGRFYEGVLEND